MIQGFSYLKFRGVNKGLLLLIALVLLLPVRSSSAYGQYQIPGDISWVGAKLPESSAFGVRFNYDRALFRGLSYEEYSSRDDSFAEGMKEAEDRFVESLQEILWDFRTTRKRVLCVSKTLENPDFVFVVRPLKINENGNFEGDVIILDSEGKPFGSMRNITGRGGRHGSYTNLIGDGYKSLAEAVAYFLANAINDRKI